MRLPALTGVVLLLISTVAGAQPFSEGDLNGYWMNPQQTSIIKLVNVDGTYFGKMTWLSEKKNSLDVNNEDESKRGRRLVGTVLMKDLQWNADYWDEGTVYLPNRGTTYNCYVNMPDKNTARINVYLGFRWISKSELWVRVAGPRPVN